MSELEKFKEDFRVRKQMFVEREELLLEQIEDNPNVIFLKEELIALIKKRNEWFAQNTEEYEKVLQRDRNKQGRGD